MCRSSFHYSTDNRIRHPSIIRTKHHGRQDAARVSVANVLVGPVVDMGDVNFELKTGLILMVQANLFCGLPSEDANAHLQHFLELCNNVIMKYITPEIIRLCLFLFSLLGRVKQWFYKDREVVNTWNKCSTAFLAKFFLMGKTNALRGRISNF